MFVSKGKPGNGRGALLNGAYENQLRIWWDNRKLKRDGAHTGPNRVRLTLATGGYTAEASPGASRCDGRAGKRVTGREWRPRAKEEVQRRTSSLHCHREPDVKGS